MELPAVRRPGLLRCRVGWHQWIVLPLQEPDFWLERLCLRCHRRQRLVGDRWNLSVNWLEADQDPQR